MISAGRHISHGIHVQSRFRSSGRYVKVALQRLVPKDVWHLHGLVAPNQYEPIIPDVGLYEGGWEYRLLSITGPSTGTTRRFRSAHRLYSCAPPRIAGRRSSATRLASPRRTTYSSGS